jgi:PAS domain S-box-containing protein
MEQVFNSLDEMILVADRKEKILFVNSKLVERFGLRKKELQEAYINDVLREEEDVLSKLIYDFDNDNKGIMECIFYLHGCEKVNCSVMVNKGIWYGEEAFFITIKEKEKYSKRELEILLDSLSYGIWMKDASGKYIYANVTHSHTFGIDREKVIGCHDCDYWDESHCDYFNKTDREVIINKRPILDEKLVDNQEGDRWFETYKAPVLDECGEVKYVVGISRDITFNKKVELELLNSHKQLYTLNEVVSSSYNENSGIFDNLKEEIIDKIGADSMSIWAYDDDKGNLSCKCFLGSHNDLAIENAEILVKYEDLKRFFHEGCSEGIKSVDEMKNCPNRDMLEKKGIKFIGVYKIEFNNKIIGVMNFLYSKMDAVKLNNDNFIKILCNQVAVIMRNDILSKEIKLELKRREETESELQLFLDTAIDLMVIIGQDDKHRKLNIGWEKTLGWSKEELLDMKWTDLLYPDDLKAKDDFVKKLKNEDKIMSLKIRLICKNGDVKWIQWNSRYLKNRKISICTGKDITEQEQLEEQRKNYEEAIKLEQIKGEFFSNISHEFKTPLNIILATMQLINQKIEKGLIHAEKEINLKKYMNSIKQNSYRLLRLVNNLIDITKIDAGYYKLQLANHNIVNIVEDITISVAQYIENKGIELIFDTEIEEEVIACDPDKIERIMLNLLSNAIKYTEVNGKIEVYLWIEEEKVFVSVTDNGEGIDGEKINLVFNRFIQVDDTLVRRYEGSGIGLSLVKSLIEMHGGSVTVTSKVGEGTKFTFYLPIRTLENQEKNKNSLLNKSEMISSKVEKCNIEFSDIYN